ncbi:MAG: metal-dependent hydrolase [Gammaproteobacteria bacterium]|nr:metal-dependent hydrolase [Gammaproteobacteria bacterium]
MIKQSNSPKGHNFSPRKPDFALKQALASDWYGGSAFRTAFENAFSMLFPLGERSFIESVKYFEDQIHDQSLLDEMKQFYGQESVHRKEHQNYNELLCKLRGYNMESFLQTQKKRYEWAKKTLPPKRRLAGTVAAEHLTAILADDLLRNKGHFKNADPAISKIWYWHAVEETEHKAVAFDVHQAVGGTIKERRRALLFVTYFIFKDVFQISFKMLKNDGKHWDPRTWLDALSFLFLRPGILRRSFFPWLRFHRSDFHPWEKDNRDLILKWDNEIQ